jgi:hypothetical protein
MTLARRSLVLLALMFWQGGLLFYGSVVVTIGSRVLDSDTTQGFITREVTLALNITAAAVMPVLLWDVLAAGRRARLVAWLVLAGASAFLAWQHGRMDALLDPPPKFIVTDYVRFRGLHRWYLRGVTVQLAAGWAFAVLSLRDWRHDDHAPGGAPQTAVS